MKIWEFCWVLLRFGVTRCQKVFEDAVKWVSRNKLFFNPLLYLTNCKRGILFGEMSGYKSHRSTVWAIICNVWRKQSALLPTLYIQDTSSTRPQKGNFGILFMPNSEDEVNCSWFVFFLSWILQTLLWAWDWDLLYFMQYNFMNTFLHTK